ncbi:MAG: restriction endonuclease [Rhizobiaceae bacterium]
MTNIWGVHMGRQVGSDPIDKGYVAIGWHQVGDISKIPMDREAYKTEITKCIPSIKKGAIPVVAGVLFRFSHLMEKGDYVIYPSKHDRMVNIGRITGKTTYRPEVDGEKNPYPNERGVEWLGHFPRSEFTQSALYEIGAFITLFEVKTNGGEFLAKVSMEKGDVAENEKSDEKPDDDQVASSVSQQAVETTDDFVIKRIVSGLSGYEFEHFIAHILECMGYTARVSDKSGDGGVDIIAHTDELGFEPPIIKVQCKRKTDQTGEPEVNQLLGTLGDGEFALFVNLGSYSRPARLLERNKSKLRLIDGEQLVSLVLEHYDNLSARYRILIPLRQIYVPDIIQDAD